MNFIIRILISGVVAFVLSKILSGIHIENIGIAIIFALVLAFLNAIVKPILILLTLPFTVLTLGLFLFVINAFIILLAAKLMDGIKIDGFWWALLFSIILSIFSSATQAALEKNEDKN
jgi:putative membrane protein